MKGFGPSQGFLSTGVAAAAFPLLAPNGTAAAPSYSWSTSGYSDDGFFHGGAASIVHLSLNGVSKCAWITADKMALASDMALAFHSGTNVDSGSSDVYLSRDAAAVLALKNGTTAQEFRVYGTTTGPVYSLLTGSSLAIGANAASAGVIRVPNDTAIQARNAANGADVLLIKLDSSNTVIVGGIWNFASTGALTSAGNYRFAHGTSALATNATEGFFHLNTCAGAPSGTPASIPSGQVPMVFDTTNSRLYIYHGAAWHYIAQTA